MRFIGCKTNLLENIKEVVDRHALGSTSFCDIFSSTSSVARYFKQWYKIYSNDILYFSYCLQKGIIDAPAKPNFERLGKMLGINNPLVYFNTMETADMENLPKEKRCFQNNYAPAGGRMYITDSSALEINNFALLTRNYAIISHMETQYSSKQLGYSTAQILMVCRDLSLSRVGNQYVLGQKEIDLIKGAIGHKPTGRPRRVTK